MVTSVRLDRTTERALAGLARQTGKSKSELIRDAVRKLTAEFHHQLRRDATAYDRLRGAIGVVRLPPGRRAASSEAILRQMFAERRRRA